MRFTLIASLISLLLSSCANLDVHRNDTPQNGGEKINIKLNSFLFGFVPGPKLPPMPDICPKGRMEMVEFDKSPGDAWLSVVTLGVYVPHRVAVTCAK